MRYITFFILLSLLFTSCDCMQMADGKVMDQDSHLPLANVIVSPFEKEDSSHSLFDPLNTNDSGQFKYMGMTVGLIGCPGLTLYFRKEGYQTIKKAYSRQSRNNVVYLHKLNE